MREKQIQRINKKLQHTDKAIIALGCSFAEGQGAINDELFNDYKWSFQGMGKPLQLDVSIEEAKEIVKRYPHQLSLSNNTPPIINWTMMELDNSFSHVLAEKYFDDEYVAINMGIRGTGNRGQIKELYFRPEIHWHKIKKIIVVYCPSGPERFDFVNDLWDHHYHWKAMWPRQDPDEKDRKLLWEGYGKSVYSEKQAIIEQIANVQELLTWCQLKNASLIITPGFDVRYRKDNFVEELEKNINRTVTGDIKEEGLIEGLFKNKTNHSYLADMWPWEKMFKPDGHETFIRLCMAQEAEPIKSSIDYFFQFLGNRSPNGYITSCAHPGQKGHDLFAKLLHKHILDNNL